MSFLKQALSHYPSVKAIKRAIDAKQCTINGRVEYFSTHPVRAGDQIEISLEAKTKFSSQILFEDEHLFVYNKAPGVASEEFKGLLVHRLDKETSGAFIVAKTEKAQENLIEQFRKKEVEKDYLAICDGNITKEKWRVDNYLGRKTSYQGGVLWGKVARDKGKHAVTDFFLLKKGKKASLIHAKPKTGRTHQIRVHLKEIGHPVLGDWQYARTFVCPHRPERLLLHAQKVQFLHPITEEKIIIKAEAFPDFLTTQKILFEA